MSELPLSDEPEVVLNPSDTDDEHRHKIFESSADRLAVMARRALNRGIRVEQFIMVCIDVNDPTWGDLVDALMPGSEHLWDSMRASGMIPVARGAASSGVRDLIMRSVGPKLAHLIGDIPTNGIVQVLSLGRGGVTLYHIRPAETTAEN